MFDFNTNHKALVWTMFLVFLGLTCIVAYYPAWQVTHDKKPLPEQTKMTPEQEAGLRVYVSENCMACHTQQVRNIEMDNMWGKRPTIAEDYFYSKKRLSLWVQSPSLLGSERTGPDLTTIGERQGSQAWQLLHLYEPRAVVEASVMPSFRWLFNEVDSSKVSESDVVVNGIPDKYVKDPGKKVVASKKALDLVEYLLSLKQYDLPEGVEDPEFIPLKEKKDKGGSGDAASASGPNGQNLFESTCAQCHQSSGEGVPGAFPSLVGSDIVNDEDPSTHIKIVLEGYNELPEYGPMPPFGGQLSDEEVAAIINYERTSWGNDGATIEADDVAALR